MIGRRKIGLILLLCTLIGLIATDEPKSDNKKTKRNAIEEVTGSSISPERKEKSEATTIQNHNEQQKTETEKQQLSQGEENINETENKNVIRPCTCGIFLSNKINKKKILVNEEPTLTQELDKKYPCSKLGVRQCQTDCFQTMIRYLPKSGEIICGLINEDIHKMKAHLFIQNCDNKWHNSNLVAGREYCCKDSKAYTCPKK